MILSRAERLFVADARTATLATMDAGGRPRLVPVCFVLVDEGPATIVYTPLDDKPKQHNDPLRVARVRDVLERPEVTLLIDRWSEDWGQLAWLRLYGHATILAPTAVGADIISGLRAKYPQYVAHRLAERPVIRVEIQRATGWGRLELP